FFQAEDGIRDRNVTGVQTCALPIWPQWELTRYRVSLTETCPPFGSDVDNVPARLITRSCWNTRSVAAYPAPGEAPAPLRRSTRPAVPSREASAERLAPPSGPPRSPPPVPPPSSAPSPPPSAPLSPPVASSPPVSSPPPVSSSPPPASSPPDWFDPSWLSSSPVDGGSVGSSVGSSVGVSEGSS